MPAAVLAVGEQLGLAPVPYLPSMRASVTSILDVDALDVARYQQYSVVGEANLAPRQFRYERLALLGSH